MAAVKGSKQEKLIVVPYHPVQRVFQRILYWLLLFAVAASCYVLGAFVGTGSQQEIIAERDKLRLVEQEQRLDLSQLRQQVASLNREKQVDQELVKALKEQVRELENDKLAQEQDLAFYKKIMSPESNDKGLQIERFILKPTTHPRRYQYKMLVTQVAENNAVLQGHVSITIVGKKSGKTQKLALKSVSTDISQQDIKLGFKYFQNIPGPDDRFGVIDLPAGFKPEYVLITGRSKVPKVKTVTKRVKWIETETQLNVGQG
ncbi:DUF6776 family protein [Spartinivicinus poritis]|uniref:Uncharacterized protein n=1 Tax=Spartinivicinus poritis TaxID=2994640 RepID=A0ABT5U9Z4_9GAMM|nr:DUF6776 family protein [Spartinivicinus sp. A2-2]MDE1463196.1 hypothetical protein [Spartinivicinus sp. A2-2]